jgi:hypothetical protein
MNGEDSTYSLEFGEYRIIINANNSSRGSVPLLNILRDPWTHSNGNGDLVTAYTQVWHGSMVEFFDMLDERRTV